MAAPAPVTNSPLSAAVGMPRVVRAARKTVANTTSLVQKCPSLTKTFATSVDGAEKGIGSSLTIKYCSMKRSSKSSSASSPAPAVGPDHASSTAIKRYGESGLVAEEVVELTEVEDNKAPEVLASSESPSSEDSAGKAEGVSSKTTNPNLDKRYKPVTDSRYERIIDRNYESYPEGWSQLSSFLNSSPSAAIYRRFGSAHARVLLHLQNSITSLEKRLEELDRADAENPDMMYRQRGNVLDDETDIEQRELLNQLRRSLSEYDDILLKDSKLRALTPTPLRNYLNVFHWIFNRKPLFLGDYDFIYHRDDFVSSANRSQNGFDDFIESCVNSWPESFLQTFLRDKGQVHGTGDKKVHYFSRAKVTLVAQILTVSVVVTILLVPVFLLALVDMGMLVMLLVMLAFVLAFATLISVAIGARAEAVFIGTCTYAAILVVFLGNVQQAVAGSS